ncbi:MAG: TatD family hydrolase [Lachnospiraceae bacterium]|nr:TatD family hydrolase [Lachnospiraceae bacterium]
MVDSHVHLQEFIKPEDLAVYLKELGRQDVTGLLCVSYDIESSRKAVELLKVYEKISETANGITFENGFVSDDNYPFDNLSEPQKDKSASLHIAAGIHPQYIADDPDSQIAELRTILNDNKNISAIGEIGLDYRKDMPDRELQKAIFRKQLEISLEFSLPVSVHSVSACEDTLKILRAYPGVKGIMHGYAYSAEAAKEFIKLGFRLGVGTTLLKTGAKKLPETVKSVPQEYLVTETDLPFSYTPTIASALSLPMHVQNAGSNSLSHKKSIPALSDGNAFECEYFTLDTLRETAELHTKVLRELVNIIQLMS